MSFMGGTRTAVNHSQYSRAAHSHLRATTVPELRSDVGRVTDLSVSLERKYD